MTGGVLAPGEAIGRFAVEGVAGRGGMGVVYKVRDPNDGLPYAVKVLHPHLVGEREFVRRFKTEARIGSRLSHINTVHVVKLRGWGSIKYYAMEFVEGRPLEEMLTETKALPVQRAVRIIRDVAGGLQYMHAKGYVHRDVKPGNILVRPDDHVKLIDFGLAQRSGAPRRTKSGHIMGTAKYMSPELIEGSHVGPQTDVYSLGIMAYEMIAGKAPFIAGDADTLMDMQLYSKHRPLEAVAQGIDERLSVFVDRMLAKRARERIPSAQLVQGWCDFYMHTGEFAKVPGT
jgi:serine/threonine-protein kinase